MLTVTEAALECLSQRLLDKKTVNGSALRFTQNEGRWRLHVDRERPNDASFMHDGRKVLLLDGSASKAMKYMTLDVRHTNEGPRLRLRKTSKS